MPGFKMAFEVRPATVAGATYAAMMVLGEHTTSLEALDDVRITLDELFYAAPVEDGVEAELSVTTEGSRATVQLRLDVADLRVHDSVQALVDGFALVHDNGTSTATFSVRW